MITPAPESRMTDQSGRFAIADLARAEAPAFEGMTFPAYRHLLSLEPAKRLPAEAEQRLVEPLALAARDAGRPAGLVVAEIAVEPGEGPPELLSVFVAAEHRAKGLGTALVAAAEEAIRLRGGTSVEAVYMTGKRSIEWLERIFARRGWDPPRVRAVTVRATMEEALAMPWYGRGGVPAGAEIVSWADVTESERRQIRESNDRVPWIPASLQPWRHDGIGFDRVSSVGLRYRGAVVGWVINHRVDDETTRFTCSFMRADLSRRARIVPLYTEAIRRLSQTGCRYCTFITPTVYPPMVDFIRRHLAGRVSCTGESRGTRKRL
jgi:GNAT superfamily N-acetyltransferase